MTKITPVLARFWHREPSLNYFEFPGKWLKIHFFARRLETLQPLQQKDIKLMVTPMGLASPCTGR